jgi:hypothetical protein
MSPGASGGSFTGWLRFPGDLVVGGLGYSTVGRHAESAVRPRRSVRPRPAGAADSERASAALGRRRLAVGRAHGPLRRGRGNAWRGERTGIVPGERRAFGRAAEGQAPGTLASWRLAAGSVQPAWGPSAAQLSLAAALPAPLERRQFPVSPVPAPAPLSAKLPQPPGRQIKRLGHPGGREALRQVPHQEAVAETSKPSASLAAAAGRVSYSTSQTSGRRCWFGADARARSESSRFRRG